MPDSAAPATAARLAPTPTPTAPVDGAVAPLDAVTFRWAAPPGARLFDLRVAAAAAPDAVLVELAELPSTETTLADALPPGDLLWWVRRSGGRWSAPARFRAGTPADVAVAQQAEGERRRAARPVAAAGPPPDPVWPYATGDALAGAPRVDWAAFGFGPPARLGVPLAAAEAPAVLGPLGGEVVDAGTVALRWSGVPGADAYEVEVSPHAAFDREVLTLDAGRATELALPGLVPAAGRKVLWRVRARLGDAATPWSRYGRFYPADADTAERFGLALGQALVAQRLQREHARRERARALELVPLHERPDEITSSAMAGAILAIALASGLLIAIAAVLAAVWM